MNDSDSLGNSAPANPEPPSSPAPAASRGPSLWNRVKSLLALRTVSLRDDLQVALEEKGSAETADFSESERTILANVLKLSNISVGDVMVERSDIQAMEADANLGDLIARFRKVGHSRLPVYDDNLDNILGFIHVKDALSKITAPVTDPDKEVPVRLVSTVLRQKIARLDILRQAMFVPTFMPVGDLLQQMRASRTHMAIVVDEYGGTDGLVTIEDLLEVVVGEIEDEHDELAASLIRKVGADVWVADARAELDDVKALLGPDFDPGEYGEEVETVGGLVFDLAGHVPKRGERVSNLPNFDFEVLASDSRRIKRLRIRRKQPLIDAPEEPLAITDQRAPEQRAAE
jgi:CBS domain containing-hemolysin-like protein